MYSPRGPLFQIHIQIEVMHVDLGLAGTQALFFGGHWCSLPHPHTAGLPSVRRFIFATIASGL